MGDVEAGSIDGSLIRAPDTPANRAAFGSPGTADDLSPFPQLRELRICGASTRATLGVVTGPSGAGAGGGRDKGEAEQVLLDKALKDYWQVFTAWRLWVMDRNFPGVPRIKDMLATGTHVLIRVKDGITLNRTGDFLPDSSYPAEISGGGITLTVRVIEYHISLRPQSDTRDASMPGRRTSLSVEHLETRHDHAPDADHTELNGILRRVRGKESLL